MAEGLDLGVVHGELALTDNFTKQLFTAARALKQVEDQTVNTGKKGGETFKALQGAAANLAGALGIGLSIGAVVQFGSHLLTVGDQLQKVADRTGMTTDEVQKLGFIADQGGNSLEDMTGAISAMQVRLNDPKSIESIRNMGINFEELRSKSPYEQMLQIAEGIGGLPTPAAQAEAAMASFGRGGLAILPTLKSAMRETGQAASLMSKETIAALDSMGDKISKWKGMATAAAGEVAVAFGVGIPKAFSMLTSGTDNFMQFMTVFAASGGDISKTLLAISQAQKAVAETPPIPPSTLTAAQQYQLELNKLILNTKTLTAEQKKQTDTGIALGQSVEQISAALGISVQSINNYVEVSKKAREAQKEFKDTQHAITDDLFGLNVTQKAGEYALALGKVNDFSKMTVEKQTELHAIFTAAVEVYKLTGRETDELALKYKALAEATDPARLTATSVAMKKLTDAQKAAWAEADREAAAATARMEELKRKTDDARKAADALRNASTQAEVTRENFQRALDIEQRQAGTRTINSAALDPYTLAKEGYSFQEILLAMRVGKTFAPKGPRIPGFEDGVRNFRGGMAIVGEGGPELVNLPAGSDVIPNTRSRGVADSGISYFNTFHLHGGDEASVRRIGDLLMKQLRPRRLLPTT